MTKDISRDMALEIQVFFHVAQNISVKMFVEQLITDSPMLRSVCLKAKHCQVIIAMYAYTLLKQSCFDMAGESSFMEDESFPPVEERTV